MSETLPVVYLARHGDTAWTHSGQHTGLTDIPLTADGELHARLLGKRLQGLKLVKVFTSPLQRAARTCELAGFGALAEVDPDLVEWNYGDYETLRDSEILVKHPDWQLFRDGCPGGESPTQIGERRPGGAACPHGRRRCASFLQRTFYSSARCAMACPCSRLLG